MDDIVKEFEKGFVGAITGIAEGLISSAFLGAISTISFVQTYYLIIPLILNLIGYATVFFKMNSWSAGYLVGWLGGQWLMYNFIVLWLLIIYTVVGVFILIYKFWKYLV